MPDVEIEKTTNGDDADTVPGPTLTVDDPVNWAYEVTNTGDLLLTDIVMPNMTGLELADLVLEMDPDRRRFRLVELAPGVTAQDVINQTTAEITVGESCQLSAVSCQQDKEADS